MMRIYKNAVGVWVLFALAAVINGALRDWIYAPAVGEAYARPLSTVIMVVVLLVIITIYLRRTAAQLNRGHLILLGLLWVALTALLELGYPHYVLETPWAALQANYNLMNGRIWALVPLTELIAPYLIGARVLDRAAAASAEAPDGEAADAKVPQESQET